MIETNPDIDFRVSLHPSTHTAHWQMKEGRYSITLALAPIWECTSKIIEKYRGYSILDDSESVRWPAYSLYEDTFIEIMNESIITELICIERRRQKLRMKYPHCHPCCVDRLVVAICRHINEHFRPVRNDE